MSRRFATPIPARLPSTLSFMITDIAMVDEDYRCTAQLFGVTAEGHSVCCHVHGFQPHVFVQCPPVWPDDKLESKLSQFIDHIDHANHDKMRQFKRGLASSSVVLDKRTIFGYCGDETLRLMRLAFHSQWARRAFCEFLGGETRFEQEFDEENGCFEQRFVPLNNGERDARGFDGGKHEFWLYDECLTPLQQFINSSYLAPSRWVTAQSVRTYSGKKASRCQYDISVHLCDIIVNDERDDIAPLIVESFDLECLREHDDGQMPDAQVEADMIIQIGSTVWRFGDGENYVCQVVHCVGETTLATNRGSENDENVLQVRCYPDEASMLSGYMRYMRDEIDPDIRLGFNTRGFDHHYLQQRLERHFDENAVEREYGRIRGDATEHCKSSYGGSRAHGNRTQYTVRCVGRVDIDVMLYARQEWKVFRGGLDLLASEVLRRAKDPVSPADIRTHWLSGDAQRRGIVAKYCAVDTELPLEIVKKRQVLFEALEMSRLCGITLDSVFNRGVSQRACAMLACEAHRCGYVQPEQPMRLVRDEALLSMFNGRVQGALVLEPNPGLYNVPVCVLDYASLYPSIMRGYGLCWTTLIIDPDKWRDVPHATQRIEDPATHAVHDVRWATMPAGKKPLLYNILTKLLDARKVAKRAMERAKADQDAFRTSLYDAKQLAIKVVCNSMYGHCNCRFASLFCPPIAAAVTHHGRRLLGEAQAYVEGVGCNVIYGDSDSLFFECKGGSVIEDNGGCSGQQGCDGCEHDVAVLKTAFAVGRQMANKFSDTLLPEIRFEFEKVYYPFAMWEQKKKYCGVKFTSPDGTGQVDSKGMVKSDTVPLVLHIEKRIVEHILHRSDQQAMLQCVMDALVPLVADSAVAEPSADLVDQLTVVTRLTKECDEYAGKSNAHVEVAREIALRCPGRAPCAGDAVEFVWVQNSRGGTGKVAIDVERFKSEPGRFRLHVQHYFGSLIRGRLEKLLDLPGIVGDVRTIKNLFDSIEGQTERLMSKGQPLERFFVVGAASSSSATMATTAMAASTTTAVKRSASASQPSKRQRTASEQESARRMARCMESFLSGRASTLPSSQ